MDITTAKLNRFVSVWVDRNTFDMRVTAEGGLMVQRARWSSWVGLLKYLRRFDPAIYNVSVRVHVPTGIGSGR